MSGTAPILLVHGAYHGAWCFAEWLECFAAEGLAATAIDLRGHGALAGAGLSPQACIADYAEDVVRPAQALPAPPILLGHSLGGLVALAAAERMPVAGLVLVAPSPPGNLPGAQPVTVVPADRLRSPPALAEVVERFLGGDATVDARRYAARLCPESPAALNERYTLAVMVNPDAIRCPVLVLEAGRDDPVRHPAGQDAGIASMFGGVHVLVPDAPHCMMTGVTARRTARLIIDWIQARCCAGGR